MPTAWDEDQREETATERLDRNWSELLQELRVVQTGVQFLTGFLLTLPFQQRFPSLSSVERGVYLVAVSCAVVATALVIAPVALHRMLFRRHARSELVSSAHRMALAGYCFLALSIGAVVMLIFWVVVDVIAGITGACLTMSMLIGLWAVFPWRQRRGGSG